MKKMTMTMMKPRQVATCFPLAPTLLQFLEDAIANTLMYSLSLQLIGQYPPPPPVATGPGLDRPLFIPTPDYNEGGYTMNRTRLFYQDQLDERDQVSGSGSGPTAFIFPDNATPSTTTAGTTQQPQRRISSGERSSFGASAAVESPRRLENETRW